MDDVGRSAASVVLVEDDTALRESLQRGLREEGFLVRAAATGTEFLALLAERGADVLIIDIGLPDSDGRDVCLAARAGGIDAPVLFLTARGAVDDRLTAFAAGADDYVVKPFSFAELVARVTALARRHRHDHPPEGLIYLDPDDLTLRTTGGDVVSLTPTEFRVLAALLAAEGSVVRRRDLARAGWPGSGRVGDNSIDSFVARLRRKLRDDTSTEGLSITTVHGVGYRLS